MLLELDVLFDKLFDGTSLKVWFVCSWERLAEGKNLLKKQWNDFMEPFKGSVNIVHSYKILVPSTGRENPYRAACVSRKAHLQL